MGTKDVNPEDLTDNPISRKVFENLTDEQFDALKADIKARGLQHPPEITTGNVIISGHERVRACRALGITTIQSIVREDLDTEAKQAEHAIKDNVLRRQLTPFDIAKAGQVLEKIHAAKRGGDHRSKEYQAGSNDPLEKARTRDKVAEVFGMSGRKYYNIRQAVHLAEKKQDKDALRKLKEKPDAAPAVLRKLKPEPKSTEKIPLDLNNLGKLWQLGVQAGSDETLLDRFLYSDSTKAAGIVPKTIGAQQAIKAHFDAEESPVPQLDYKVGPDHEDQEMVVNVNPQHLRQLLDLAKHYPKITLKVKPGNPVWIDTQDFILFLAPMKSDDEAG